MDPSGAKLAALVQQRIALVDEFKNVSTAHKNELKDLDSQINVLSKAIESGQAPLFSTDGEEIGEDQLP